MDDNGLPLAFGKVVKKKVVDDSRIEVTKRVEAMTASAEVSEATFEAPRRAPDSDDDDEDSDDDGADWVATRVGDDLPVSHEIVMKDHHKTISALSVDKTGTRIVSGSYDYDAKLWDFSGMNASFKPFRSFELKEGHQIHDIQFSPSGDTFLAATGSSMAKVYSREGIELTEFVKGDVYIRDLRHTDGHVAALTSIAWNPKKPTEFLTASADSTLRIWELSNKRKSKAVIIVKSKERGGRTKISACAWSSDGKTIAAACEDGAIHLWSASSNFARPNATVEGAHEKGTVTSSVVFTKDGRQLASRGGDGTVKLWDTKAMKKPLFVATGLPSLNVETNLVFSPDERYIITGTSGSKAGVLMGSAEEEKAKEAAGAAGGKIVVLLRENLEVVRAITISPFSVVRVLWHPTINQILTGSSDGSIHVLYSPLTSLKGATIALNRAPRVRSFDDFAGTTSLDRPIIAPHSLPMFKDDYGDAAAAGGRGGKRKRERERHDAQKTMKPMPPIVGAGRGGRVGSSATQHMVQGLFGENLRDDPREALLKYAAGPQKDDITSAWHITQPKTIYDDRDDPADEKAHKEERLKE